MQISRSKPPTLKSSSSSSSSSSKASKRLFIASTSPTRVSTPFPIHNTSHSYVSRHRQHQQHRHREEMSKRTATSQLDAVVEENTPQADNQQNTNNNNNNSHTTRKKAKNGQSEEVEKVALDSKELTTDAGLDATTPLRHTPYTKQLGKKRKELYSTFAAMTREIETQYKKSNRMNKDQYIRGNMGDFRQFRFDQPHRTQHKICCITGPVVPSPSQEAYRNKNEFTIGYGINSENPSEIEVGYLCGRFADGESRVGSPEGSLNTPPVAIEISRKVKEFLNTNEIAKKYTPWVKTTNSGLYRLLTVRDCPVTKQLMICLQINPIAFTPANNHLTSANPRIDSFEALPKDQQKGLREEHIKARSAMELKEVQSAAMEEFSIAFRDFCIENFHGGAIWRAGVTPRTAGTDGTGVTTFVPPHDTYDLTEGSEDTKMTATPPSYAANNMWTNKKLYKGVSSVTAAAAADALPAGQVFVEKHGYSLASVILQTHCGVANVAETDALQLCVFGSHYIYAQLSKLFFRVSVNSFLQVNIRAATTLYNIAQHWAMAPKHDFSLTVDEVKEKYVKQFTEVEQKYLQVLYEGEFFKTSITPTSDAKLNPDDMIIPPPAPLESGQKPSVLFDVCCGTGTIGLINASSAQKVVGVDIVQAAIDDAKANARLNNISSAEFVCGKAEDAMETILRSNRASIDTSVAILDPPRNGLHSKVLSALRESSLQRIVYISCNQNTLADDVVRLAGPPSKSYPGLPFVPIAAIGVDLFPHTEHTEAVMLLERREPGSQFHLDLTQDVPEVTGKGDNLNPRRTDL